MKTIIITKERDEYCATLEDDPEVTVRSTSFASAIGKLVLFFRDKFEITIK